MDPPCGSIDHDRTVGEFVDPAAIAASTIVFGSRVDLSEVPRLAVVGAASDVHLVDGPRAGGAVSI